jgi:hypothetical protein
MDGKRLRAGQAYPLGAHWDGRGINFALVAPHAQAVDLCLFDAAGTQELARLALPACEDGVWHGYLDGAEPGLVYGYRVAGPYAPQQGQRFNPNKVLLDPYARRIVGQYLGQPAFRGQAVDAVDQPDPVDNADVALKAQVVHEAYDWAADGAIDTRPRVAPADTVLYEVHVKGFTKLHPDVPEALRGTYAGLAQPAVLDYLQDLGVTTVSLLPVHARADEMRLQHMGLVNYWGYSSIGFFAPENRYWSGRPDSSPISEFRDMIKALHARGIEVVLDVVYNHSAETDELGPTLSFRGIDNELYYHLQPGNPRLYENWTGCGNCLNLAEPRVLQLVMDSLRYWVQEMHVDGFRFDLAPILARGADGFASGSAFLAAVRQDPVLSTAKLIAEPWDIGPDGYRLGHFPPGWLEWNDKYRDTMRAFWLRPDIGTGALGEFARRFAGSSDVFQHPACEHAVRLPTASVNFIAAHDGFTARPGQLRPQAQRGQRRAEPRRPRRKPEHQLRRRRPHRRRGRAATARAPATRLDGDLDVLAGHAHAAGRRRHRPHPAGQQQCVLPGQCAELAGLAGNGSYAGGLQRAPGGGTQALPCPAPRGMVQRCHAARRPPRHRMAAEHRRRARRSGLERRSALHRHPHGRAGRRGRRERGRRGNLPAARECRGAGDRVRPAPGHMARADRQCRSRRAAARCRRRDGGAGTCRRVAGRIIRRRPGAATASLTA